MRSQSHGATLNPDFREILQHLVAAGVEFVIVGAYAVGFHLEPRATGDIDIWVRPTPENAHRVWAGLVSFGAPMIDVTVEDFASPRYFYQIGIAPVRVDILTHVAGLTFAEAWPRTETGFLDDVPVRYLNLEDLLRAKEAANRDKDQSDIRRLRKRLQRPPE